jgi:hypothetical protein
VTMANILCNNVDVDFLQQYAFYVPKKDYNPLVDCSSTYNLDLNLWANQNSTNQFQFSAKTSTTTTSTTTTTAYFSFSGIISLKIIDVLQILDEVLGVACTCVSTAFLNQNPAYFALKVEFVYLSDIVNSNSTQSQTLVNAIAAYAFSLYNCLPSNYSTSSLLDLYIAAEKLYPGSYSSNFSVPLTFFLESLSFPGANALAPSN